MSGQVLSAMLDGDVAATRVLDNRFALPDAQRYEARQLLGIGGMGRVVAVVDQRLDREIAMKSPNPETRAQSRLDVALAREALITARIDHPGVVPIYDAGVGPDGRLFYTMAIVRGLSLAEALSVPARPEELRRLLRRLLEAVEAVAAAHRVGIVHSDLKPANIMLGEGGGTRVLDWGLARLATDGSLNGAVVGTPQYMSPEQALGRDFDMRADVWSLGAILYEVCTARPVRDLGSASEVLARARVQSSVAPMNTLDASIPSELSAIVAQALALRPEDRYPDAGALAVDLASYLDGRRVGAYEYSARELLFRLVRAWRVPLMITAAALVVLSILLVIGFDRLSAEATRSATAAARALRAEGRAKDALETAARDLATSLSSQASLKAERGARPEAELLAAHALAYRESPLMRGVVGAWSVTPSPRLVARQSLPACLGVSFDPSSGGLLCRESEALSAWSFDESGLAFRWRRGRAAVTSAEAEGFVLAFESSSYFVVLDAESGELLDTVQTPCERQLSIVSGVVFTTNTGCFSAYALEDRRPLAVSYPCVGYGILGGFAASNDAQRWAAVCQSGVLIQGRVGAQSDDWESVPTTLGEDIVMSLAFVSSERLVAGTGSGRVVLLDARTGATLGNLDTGLSKVIDLAIDDRTGVFAARSINGDIAFVEPLAGLVRPRLPALSARDFAFGKSRLYVGGEDVRAYAYEPGPLNELTLGAGVTTVMFSPDGEELVTTTGEWLEVRRLSDGALVRRSRLESGFIKSGTFSPDGSLFFIATANLKPSDYWVSRVWDTNGWMELTPTSTLYHARRIAALDDGPVLTTPYAGGIRAFWPWEGSPSIHIVETQGRFADLATSPSGRFAVALGEDGAVIRVTAPGPMTEQVAHSPKSLAAAIADDGNLIVTAGDGSVRWWDAERGLLVHEVVVKGGYFGDVAISPDMRLAAAGGRDGTVYVWSNRSGRLLARFAVHRERVSTLAFSPDSRRLVSGSWDGSARILDMTRIETSAVDLIRELESSWGIDLEDAIGASGELVR